MRDVDYWRLEQVCTYPHRVLLTLDQKDISTQIYFSESMSSLGLLMESWVKDQLQEFW